MKNIARFLTITFLTTSLLFNCIFAEDLYDKKGRLYIETVAPTATPTSDPGELNVALRKNRDSSKNINSENIIAAEEETIKYEVDVDLVTPVLVRHTNSIAVLEDNDRYELIYDNKADRMKMLIFVDNAGLIEAKDGFYQIEDKVYFFDDTGHMVLGPAVDTIGNQFMFSYETGELIEEIQVK